MINSAIPVRLLSSNAHAHESVTALTTLGNTGEGNAGEQHKPSPQGHEQPNTAENPGGP